MSLETFFNLFLIVSAIHGFAFNVFLFRQKNERANGMFFLNLMILMIALNNLQSWLLTKNFYFLKYIQIPWHFLIAPFFYTFLIRYLKIQDRFIDILKVIFPIFITAIAIQVVWLSFFEENYSPLQSYFLYERYTAFEDVISFISSLSIFIYCFRIIKFKPHLFKDLLTYDNLNWLNNFIILASTSYVLWALALSVRFYFNFENFIAFYYPLRVITTILIYWLGYELLSTLRQVRERKSIRKSTTKTEKVKTKNISEKFLQVEEYIIHNRKFLNPLLSLDSLAKELQISTSQLSKIVNDHTTQNFNSLINKYRIEFSKKLLLDSNYEHYTITSIALESGFNSKSTFYNAFKRETGLTPTQFKDNQ